MKFAAFKRTIENATQTERQEILSRHLRTGPDMIARHDAEHAHLLNADKVRKGLVRWNKMVNDLAFKYSVTA